MLDSLAEPRDNGWHMGHIPHGCPPGALHGLRLVRTRHVLVQIFRPYSFGYDLEASNDVGGERFDIPIHAPPQAQGAYGLPAHVFAVDDQVRFSLV